MFSEINLMGVLRALATFLKIPVLIVLILFCAAAVVLAGSLIAEFFTERLRLKASLPRLTDEISESDDLKTVIRGSGLLKRQKTLLLELTAHTELDGVMLEALARKLVSSEENHYNAITKITDVIARLGPMFGLLGTLIPLGPGLIALGQGDTYTLSQSMLTAFDTTIAGLAAAAVSFVLSSIRKRWYEGYMTSTEALTQCILEKMKGGTTCERPEVGVDAAPEEG